MKCRMRCGERRQFAATAFSEVEEAGVWGVVGTSGRG